VAKPKTLYVCQSCGASFPKWGGQCSACHAWNTLEESVEEAASHRYSGVVKASPLQKLSTITVEESARLSTQIPEFDRVLGGGIVDAGVVLIGGDPGIGKSTLLLQTLAELSRVGENVLYVSGEESAAQIALRAQRISSESPDLAILPEIQLEKIMATIEAIRPRVAVIDSIQTIYSEALTSAPGSVAQVRECAAQLTRLAKATGVSLILVGHVTKDGNLAGPRVLEHIVDAVLYFEGDTHSSFRLVRAIKNRFGAVNELGVFAMTDRGLKGVSNPSALFLSQHAEVVPGSCVLVTQEGSRPLLVEIQALVDTSHVPNPRRLALGLEQHRLAMLLAVLHRHAGIACFDQDVFLNAVGGVKIGEPAADLAVLMAIQSSIRNKALPKDLVVFGEVGLAGEIRACARGQERLKEAAKLGFKRAIIPKANAPKAKISADFEIFPVERIDQAISILQQF
jgi:DNA repair protein RadA/Sms